MAAMLPRHGPLLARQQPAEKENQLLQPAKRMQGKQHIPVAPRKRMALKAINGDDHYHTKASNGPNSSGKAAAPNGRMALSNLTNKAAASGGGKDARHQQQVVQKTPLNKCTTTATATVRTAAKPAGVKKPRAPVPDVEQPYPKQVVPVFIDEVVPPLPRNWTSGLSPEIWAPADVYHEDTGDLLRHLSVEAYEPCALESVDFFAIDDDAAYLHHDLAEDAKNLAELIS